MDRTDKLLWLLAGAAACLTVAAMAASEQPRKGPLPSSLSKPGVRSNLNIQAVAERSDGNVLIFNERGIHTLEPATQQTASVWKAESEVRRWHTSSNGVNLAIVGDAAIVLDSEGRELSRSSFEAAQSPFSAALSEDGSHYALILDDQTYTVRVSATSREITRGHCASVSLEVGNNGTVLLGFGEGYQALGREKRAVDYREIDQEMRLSTDG